MSAPKKWFDFTLMDWREVSHTCTFKRAVVCAAVCCQSHTPPTLMLNKPLDRGGKYELNSEAAFSFFMSPKTLLHNDRLSKKSYWTYSILQQWLFLLVCFEKLLYEILYLNMTQQEKANSESPDWINMWQEWGFSQQCANRDTTLNHCLL